MASLSEDEDEIEELIKVLSERIDNSSTADHYKAKWLRRRAHLYYQVKNWTGVIADVTKLERMNKCNSKLMKLKIKAQLQNECRKARLTILQAMNNGDHTSECDTLFMNLSDTNMESVLEGCQNQQRKRAGKRNIHLNM